MVYLTDHMKICHFLIYSCFNFFLLASTIFFYCKMLKSVEPLCLKLSPKSAVFSVQFENAIPIPTLNTTGLSQFFHTQVNIFPWHFIVLLSTDDLPNEFFLFTYACKQIKNKFTAIN